MYYSRSRFALATCLLATFVVCLTDPTFAQDSSLKAALKIEPKQKDVDYDQPSAADMKNCRIEKAIDVINLPGWLVIDSSDRLIRKFVDNNRDKKLDQWSYFKDGVEVYRDIDSDYDGKTDQYRWLGSAGTRWGIDEDQDGVIDYWKIISPEEVAFEAYQAVKDRDEKRFLRVLMTRKEAASLGLGPKMSREISQRINQAAEEFSNFARKQKQIRARSEWMHFGTTRPGVAPAGNEGLEQDIFLYDHASAVLKTGEEYDQLAVGSIVKVGDAWRLIELPQVVMEGKPVTNGGAFCPLPRIDGSAIADANDPVNEKIGELSEKWKTVETKIAAARRPREIQKLELERFDLMKNFVVNTKGEDRRNWLRIMTDTVTDSYQRDRFPNGISLLDKFRTELEKAGSKELLDYIDWRILGAEFAVGLKGDNKERAQATDKYMDSIEDFVRQNQKSEFAPEALMILATNYEVSDGNGAKKSIEWYERLARAYPDTKNGKKAKGALTRLNGIGKKLSLTGKTLNGQNFSIAAPNLRGKVVLIHYWQDWCDVCKKDFDEFKRLASKYRGKLIIVGANLDDEDVLKDYLAKNRDIRWPQLSAPGGTEDSVLAQQLGVSTLPMVIIVDQEGKLVETNVAGSDVEREIQRLLKESE